MPTPAPMPLVYACSGCSSAAQRANHVVLRLDREGLAEMPCIAGRDGDVPSPVEAERVLAHCRGIAAAPGP
jgi:uncharacterized metal-binding protein